MRKYGLRSSRFGVYDYFPKARRSELFDLGLEVSVLDGSLEGRVTGVAGTATGLTSRPTLGSLLPRVREEDLLRVENGESIEAS